MKPTDKLQVKVHLANTGKYDGEETVQLYPRYLCFRYPTCKKAESLSAEDLKFYNSDLKWIYEPGDFKVFVGGNSRDVQEGAFVSAA